MIHNYKKFFENKKITVMGLGLLGGALNDIIFLAEHGANLVVTDLKDAKDLRLSLNKLKKYPQIKFVLGGHKIEDFKNTDIILQPGNVPMNSPYLVEAKKNNIPVFVSESLFAKYSPDILFIGITGTRGKSMVAALVYEILLQNIKNSKVHLGGNVRDVSTLALLDKIKPGDIVVMELDSWALRGLGYIKKSPHISVFTSFMPDHMNYYGSTSLTTSKKAMKKYFADKANIFKFQNKNDILIIRPDMKKLIPQNLKSRLIVADKENVKDWKFIVPGEHQRENLACAVEVAKQLKIPMEKIKKTVENFKGLEGRLQYLKTVKSVKIYNDNNATTPEATIAGLKALSFPKESLLGKNIILICGGADKNLDLDDFIKAVNKYCKMVIMIPGSGTDKLKAESRKLKTKVAEVKDLSKAVKIALGLSSRGDTILFSPAFASFGMFKNEYERNDEFMKIIKKLK